MYTRFLQYSDICWSFSGLVFSDQVTVHVIFLPQFLVVELVGDDRWRLKRER